MTLTEEAQAALDELGLDRDDALLAAKSIGRAIIESSKSGDTPLTAMVYDVWGLYDEGVPACRFGLSASGDDFIFVAQFRTQGAPPFVERRRTVAPDVLKSLVDRADTDRS